MKICYILDTDLNNGGAPISAHILAKEMAENGNDVFLIMPESKRDKKEIDEIKYIRLEKFNNTFPFELLHPIKFMRFLFELGKQINKISPSIVHAQMPRSGRAVSILKKLGVIDKNIKLVFTDREYVIDLKKRYKVMYSKTISSNFDMVINLSNSSKKFWNDTLKMGRSAVIPNPGGKLFDEYKSKDYEFALENFKNIPRGKVNIVFVGRMTWEKRWDLAKKVIYMINEKYKDFINIIIVLSCKNKELKKEVDEYENRFIGMDNVFIFRNLSQEKLSSIYYISDIHVITSCRESFGRTAIEAMSRKTVVLSTDAGAIKETIGRADCITGDKPEEIIKYIERYLSDRKVLQDDKERFYDYYQNKYTTTTNFKAHKNVYDELLNE